jgi:hypothetical protein
MRKVDTKNGTSNSNTKKTRYCYQKYHFFNKKFRFWQGCGAGAGRSRNFWLEPEPVY